ncbi:hypothetical protein DQ384_36410 [Sphaerisporangium album]|uniref:Uncharacterized protein n=1 Tax=Sphaerisporangium album TaxID=509200 RepID=A0A367EWI9_9ACTN|nr:hypothetical protein [Sphaerisporangium album]RCG21945.1 hypothetical protein DQ384_36410 [Sphaerisporangium album]
MTFPHPLPIDAFPRAVFASDQRAVPEAIGVDQGEHTITLRAAGLMLSTPRQADDTRILGSIEAARLISQAAERYGALLRAELERRQREQQAELAHVSERGHPYPDPPAGDPAEAYHTLALPEGGTLTEAADAAQH